VRVLLSLGNNAKTSHPLAMAVELTHAGQVLPEGGISELDLNRCQAAVSGLPLREATEKPDSSYRPP